MCCDTIPAHTVHTRSQRIFTVCKMNEKNLEGPDPPVSSWCVTPQIPNVIHYNLWSPGPRLPPGEVPVERVLLTSQITRPRDKKGAAQTGLQPDPATQSHTSNMANKTLLERKRRISNQYIRNQPLKTWWGFIFLQTRVIWTKSTCMKISRSPLNVALLRLNPLWLILHRQ